MASGISRNLSYSTNLPKATVHCEEVMVAVNETLKKYYNEAHYADYVTYYNLHKSLCSKEKSVKSAVMQTEKIILCEINAGLWNKALNSAVSSITKHAYPHYVIVKNIVNYVLSASSDEYFGIIEEFFCKLLFSHPPNPDMYEYYWQIMSDCFVNLSDKKTEEEPLIFCLFESIINCLKIRANSLGVQDLAIGSGLPNSRKDNQGNLKVKHFSDMDFQKTPDGKTNKKQMFFADLPVSEQIKRCLLLLKVVYDILETNFIFWIKSKQLTLTFSDPLLLMSSLLWQNVRDIGLINSEVNKLLDFYEVVQSTVSDFQIKQLTKKFVTLLGEVIRCSDNVQELKFPFIGTKSENFFRELSVILHQSVTEQKKELKENGLIVNFKPPWLRLFVCSRLLSLITGYHCLPELSSVFDILEHIAHSESRSENVTKVLRKPKKSINSRLMAKLKRFKSVNTKLKNGKTLLHEACEENDTEKIKALLTFPELDVNATDREGWTALHVAAQKGNITSIEELLSFCPKSKDAQKAANTRARGPESFTPLMCAVSQGHAKICQLLLEHSGSVLLEDVNELNQTPLELSNAPEVTDILQYYKKNNVWTLHSHKDINFDPDLKATVLKLCVEMIQAYFSTYRTWDVYKTLKRSEKDSLRDLNLNSKWDYMRYHRDIKRNIYKLRRLIPKLEHLEEFKHVSEVYVRILSFNKTC